MKRLTLSDKDQARLQILNKVIGRELVVPEAALLIGLSERQVWRISADDRKDGAAALAHGNLGKKPINTTGEETKRLGARVGSGGIPRSEPFPPDVTTLIHHKIMPMRTNHDKRGRT